jgi:hypothetical protein
MYTHTSTYIHYVPAREHDSGDLRGADTRRGRYCEKEIQTEGYDGAREWDTWGYDVSQERQN